MSDDIPSLAAKTFAGLSRLHASFRLPPADEAYWADVRENYLKWNGSMSDDEPIPSLAEALTEIRRLRHCNELLELDIYTLRKEQHLDHLQDRLRIMHENQIVAARETGRQISLLQTRIAELEGSLAVTFGTLEQPTPDWPTTVEHNIPPNAPPHNE